MAGKTPPKPRPKGAGRRARRGVGPEDQALWDKVTRDATPLEPAQRVAADEATPPPGPAKPKPTPAPPRARRTIRPTGRPTGSGKTPTISIDLADRSLAPPGRSEPGLDRRNAERLRRGDRAPDGRIDLHGMTAERAHLALDRRVGQALASGERLLLVITGKGGRHSSADDAAFMRTDQGVLRQQAPRWLRNGPHAAHLVGIYQAHLRHGGAGAFYVYLKKRR